MILVVGSKMLPKCHRMLIAKNLSFIFLEEAFSNSCAPLWEKYPKNSQFFYDKTLLE